MYGKGGEKKEMHGEVRRKQGRGKKRERERGEKKKIGKERV